MTTNPPKKKPTSKQAPVRIKNYASTQEMSGVFETIRHSLATHKAKRIMFDYDDEGQAMAITFMIEVNGEQLVFRLPNRFDRVKPLVVEAYHSMGKYITGERLDEQAYRTSWANIRDWILAQMALIDSQMVCTEEVFLPYLLTPGNQTLFEAMQEQQFLLPSPGNYTISEVDE